MKKNLIFLTVIFMISTLSFAQEICNNAIDDDGDGLIDLNDDDCDCGGFVPVESLIPNHSFEDHTCCPWTFSQLDCADTWVQASDATSDYFNTCGITSIFADPEFPLPGGGEGYVGFYAHAVYGYDEYIGACLDGPLIAGTSYVLNLFVAYSNGGTGLDLSIYGTPNCADLPWAGLECPIGVGDWELLDHANLVLNPDHSWMEVTLTFTPPVDMDAIAIGGACVAGDGVYSYYFVDELTLLDEHSFYGMDSEGGWCSDDLVLTAETDTVGGGWQWYKNGVAIIGEVSEAFNPVPYGEGEFTAVYTLDDYCESVSYFSPETSIIADFTFESHCFPGVSSFENISSYDDIDEVVFEWDFGDGEGSGEESPTHEYAVPGAYDVTLIVKSADSTCNDTMMYVFSVGNIPVAEIDLTSDGLFDWAGHLVVCTNEEVNFISLSTVDAPSIIDSWKWYVDGVLVSTDENPIHIFTDIGVYDISLEVETNFGCIVSTFAELYVTGVDADFTTDNQCAFDEVVFNNTSTVFYA